MMNNPFRPLPGNFGFMSNELALDTETALWPFGYANTGVNNTTARSDGVDIQANTVRLHALLRQYV